jgi:ribulose-5-phosphate 4-epimerase/fuculose-1-phosphate aldolase
MSNKFLEGYRGIVGFRVEHVKEKGLEKDLQNYVNRTGLLEGFRYIGSEAYKEGWASKNAGNISTVEIPLHHRFFITAAGSYLSDLKPEDIVCVHSLEVRIGKGKEDIKAGIIPLASTMPRQFDLSLNTVADALMKQNLLDDVINGMGLDRTRINIDNFSLKNVLVYLGSHGMVKCKAEAIGSKDPSSETFLHGLIYSRRIEYPVNAIVHCHAPQLTENPSAVYIPETDSPFEDIGYGTLDLGVEAVEKLGEKNLVLLREHGPVAVSSLFHEECPEGHMSVFKDIHRKLKEANEKYSHPKDKKYSRKERWPDYIHDFEPWQFRVIQPSFFEEKRPDAIRDSLEIRAMDEAAIRMIRRGIKWEPRYYRRKAKRDYERTLKRIKEGRSLLNSGI